MELILYIILLPAISGCVLFVLPDKWKTIKGIISFIISVGLFYYAFQIFRLADNKFVFSFSNFSYLSEFLVFNIDGLSKMVVLFISFFGVIISLYSIKFVENVEAFRGYWTKFLLSLSVSFGAVLSDNLITFTIFWDLFALILYSFLGMDDEKSSAAAKKSLIIIYAADSILMLGRGLLCIKKGCYFISEMNIQLSDKVAIVGFISLLVAALTKAGAFPLHTWIPDYTESAPGSVSAFLPASLDKLLGIYFLARICKDIFVIEPWANFLLLLIGSITIIAAVMLALVQHNYKKLLGYHAISQVGYMVMGIGLGTPIGIAAGLFHMVNNALYKSGLFLAAGAVQKKTGEVELDAVGGLSANMPLTFITALIFALSISGVPPLNGFVSKWTIYQGIVDFGMGVSLASRLWFVWLGAAVFGSALTLASFIKFISGVYLGRRKEKFKEIKEVSLLLWSPMLIIAILCVIFGIWGTNFVIPNLIKPAVGEFGYIGLWESQLVGLLIIVGIVLGFVIYLIGNLKKMQVRRQFIGGEIMSDEMQYPSVEFYKTITELKILNWVYQKAKEKYFDIYEIGKNIVLWFGSIFSYVHTGVLTLYMIWALIGLGIIILILI